MGKSETIPNRNGQVDEKLKKPFTLGWTREVVKRVLAKSPTCDIYYFSPDGKKLRSLREVTAFLSDSLQPDCFSFKREIFGVDNNFETVRDANYKRKISQNRQSEREEGFSGTQPRKRKINLQNQDSSLQNAAEDLEFIKAVENISQKQKAQNTNTKNLKTKKKGRSARAKVPLPQIEKKNFRRVVCKQKRQGQILTRKKLKRKVATKKNEETENTKNEESELKVKAEAVLKGSEEQEAGESMSKSVEIFLRSREKSAPSALTETKGKKAEEDLRTKEIPLESTKPQAENEEEKEDEGSTDLKSIVQKNIGKYRKLREKQKMKLISAHLRKSRKRMVNNSSFSRAESFLQNRNNYLKPLQKGWRRELVYRSNCTKSGLQADVYYFHPNGKKFRSSREIMDNPEMIRGLSIEFFTFRKEAVGCGEPLEVIRNARICHKH